jgi:hypothetical protein
MGAGFQIELKEGYSVDIVLVFTWRGAPNSADYTLWYAKAVEHTLFYLAEAGWPAKVRRNGGVRQRKSLRPGTAGMRLHLGHSVALGGLPEADIRRRCTSPVS